MANTHIVTEPKNKQDEIKPLLKSHNPWITLLLMIVTYALYVPIWFLRREKEINSLVKEKKLSKISLYIFLILNIISFVAFPGIFIIGYLPEIFVTIFAFIFVTSFLVDLILCIYWIVLAFRVRKILYLYLKNHNQIKDYTLSGPMTFFFTIVYLDYKISEIVKLEENYEVV